MTATDGSGISAACGVWASVLAAYGRKVRPESIAETQQVPLTTVHDVLTAFDVWDDYVLARRWAARLREGEMPEQRVIDALTPAVEVSEDESGADALACVVEVAEEVPAVSANAPVVEDVADVSPPDVAALLAAGLADPATRGLAEQIRTQLVELETAIADGVAAQAELDRFRGEVDERVQALRAEVDLIEPWGLRGDFDAWVGPSEGFTSAVVAGYVAERRAALAGRVGVPDQAAA